MPGNYRAIRKYGFSSTAIATMPERQSLDQDRAGPHPLTSVLPVCRRRCRPDRQKIVLTEDARVGAACIGSGSDAMSSRGLVDDALNFAAVDVEFAGYGALTVTRLMPGPYPCAPGLEPVPARVVHDGPRPAWAGSLIRPGTARRLRGAPS